MPRIDLTARESATRPRPLWPHLAGLAGTLVAAPAYVALLNVPLIRATGWPMFLLSGLGAVGGALYARWDDRTWVRLTGVGNVVVLALIATWFFWIAALPRPDAQAKTLATAPEFTLPDQYGRPTDLRGLRRDGPVLLTFYRGSWCPFCVAELRGLATIEEELARAGVKLAAISVDSPTHAQQAAERLGLKFPLLSDGEKSVIREFGLVHPGGGPGGEDVAIPAHYLVARDGRILWRRVAARIQDRPDPQDLLRAVQAALVQRHPPHYLPKPG